MTEEKGCTNTVEYNYCRQPDCDPTQTAEEYEGAWCYTTDPEVRWEYCSCAGRDYYF